MWQVVAKAGMATAFIFGLRWRNSNKIYFAMLSLVLCGVLMAFAGCAAQPVASPQVVVKHDLAPPPKPVIPDDPYLSLPADVAAAIRSNQSRTFHHGVTWIEPYSPDLQYPLHCKPLHVTQIRLQLDEFTDKDDVKIGDKDRWGTIVGPHSVLVFPLGTNTNITFPGAQVSIPRDPNMVTNLVISTN